MRVCVEESVLEDHLQENPGRLSSQCGSVERPGFHVAEIRYLGPAHAFERQYASGAEIPMHPRDVDKRIVPKVFGEALDITALAHVVQLRSERLCEFLGNADEVILIGQIPAP